MKLDLYPSASVVKKCEDHV